MKVQSAEILRNENAVTTETSAPFDVAAMDGAYSVHAVWDVNTPAAKTFDSGVYEVSTLTFDTKANTAHQDFIIVSAASGVSYAVALTKPVAEVQTLTFEAKAATDNGDFVIVEDTAGVKYAIAADTTGGALVTPAGALWTAATRKALVDISGATTAASVAALFEIAFNALTGFTTAITTNDTAADGTMTLTQVLKAPAVNPVPKNFDESTAGGILGVQTTGGVASVAPSGVLWTAATYKGLADISSDTTAAHVAARAETAFNDLTGFTAAITSSDAAANGTMTMTQVSYGVTTNPVPKNAAESAAGTVTTAETTAGVGTELDLVLDAITIPAHGLTTGLKGQLTTTTTLPTGLSLATDYFVISVDAASIKLATSLANALVGTAVNITAEGVGVHTFTSTAIAGAVVKLQSTNDDAPNPAVTATWLDISSMTANITADSSTFFQLTARYRYIRAHVTITAGRTSIIARIQGVTP